MRRLALVSLLTAPACAGFYRSTEAYQSCTAKNGGRDEPEQVDRYCREFAQHNEDVHYDEGVARASCTNYGTTTNCVGTYKPVQDAVEVPTMPRGR